MGTCERLGTTLVHAKPYDAPARGKMERFWRTLRQGCLRVMSQLSSLHDVSVRLYAFVDEHGHWAPHAGLMGRAPGLVWHERAGRRPADHLNEQTLRESLTIRERRRVRRDTTLTIDGRSWALEAGFLACRVVTVARCLLDPDSAPWVEHVGKRLPLHPVDPVANSRPRRWPLDNAAPQPSVPFDPPGALLDQAVGRLAGPKTGRYRPPVPETGRYRPPVPKTGRYRPPVPETGRYRPPAPGVTHGLNTPPSGSVLVLRPSPIRHHEPLQCDEIPPCVTPGASGLAQTCMPSAPSSSPSSC